MAFLADTEEAEAFPLPHEFSANENARKIRAEYVSRLECLEEEIFAGWSTLLEHYESRRGLLEVSRQTF